MDGEKPLIEQMTDNVPSAEDIQENIVEGTKNVGESLNEMKDSVKDSLNEFSNKSIVNASSEFLDSNSLLAKFSFIILVVIIFMVVLKIMMSILGYFLSPSRSPYIVKGSLSGNDRIIIHQDPSKDESVPIFKSNDRHRGLEYTWSVWLFLNTTSNTTNVRNVFVKGDENFDTSYNLMNGPGMYLESKDISGSATNEYVMHIAMDHIGGEGIISGSSDNGRDIVEVDSIPIQKWVHVAIRMQNTVLDVYVNGTIAKRHNMEFAPKQNFNDVVVCGNGGFDGKLSNLRYYSYALNVFEINNVVMWGPNTTPSELSIDSKAKSGTYSYLSNMWYSDKY